MKGTLGGGQNSSHGAQVCGRERGSSDWFSPPGVQVRGGSCGWTEGLGRGSVLKDTCTHPQSEHLVREKRGKGSVELCVRCP